MKIWRRMCRTVFIDIHDMTYSLLLRYGGDCSRGGNARFFHWKFMTHMRKYQGFRLLVDRNSVAWHAGGLYQEPGTLYMPSGNSRASDKHANAVKAMTQAEVKLDAMPPAPVKKSKKKADKAAPQPNNIGSRTRGGTKRRRDDSEPTEQPPSQRPKT